MRKFTDSEVLAVIDELEKARERCDSYRRSVEANCREIERLEAECNALFARVAKLKAALMEARGWVRAFNSAEVVHQGDMLKQIDAALKDAPQ